MSNQNKRIWRVRENAPRDVLHRVMAGVIRHHAVRNTAQSCELRRPEISRQELARDEDDGIRGHSRGKCAAV